MSLEQQIAALVSASNNLTGEVAGKIGQIDAAVVAKKAELDVWRQGARSEMALPFVATITVGGDAATYYPVPIRVNPNSRLGRLVIYRDHGAPCPPSLGVDHVAGLVLELRSRGDLWGDFQTTRVDYYGFSYHLAVGRVRTDAVGRVVWLRGGGMQYQFLSDYDLRAGEVLDGTELLKPLLVADSPLYPLLPGAPYQGGAFKVSPLAAPDSIWTSHITTPTTI